MMILIVSKTPSCRHAVSAALTEECDVRFAADEIDAISKQLDTKCDLYILGNRLASRTGGLMLIREARAEKDETPTIVFSSETNDVGRVQISELGAVFIDAGTIDAVD